MPKKWEKTKQYINHGTKESSRSCSAPGQVYGKISIKTPKKKPKADHFNRLDLFAGNYKED